MSSEAARTAREVFDQQLERTYHQAVFARAVTESMTEVANTARAELEKIATSLLPHEGSPMAALCHRFGLTPEQRDFIWSVVACSFDARVTPHVEAIGGTAIRRGLSLATYARLGGHAKDAVVELAHWLAAHNPLVATGLLVLTEPLSPATRPYVASSRLGSFLAGREESIEPLRLVRENRSLLHDRRQAAAIDEIAGALSRGQNPVIVVEGPMGSGRATACACSVGHAGVIVLDCTRIGAEELGEALLALQRETLLRAVIPVIANADHVLGDDRREQRRLLGKFIDNTETPLLITTTVHGAELGTMRSVVRIAWDVPDTEIRARLWSAAAHSAGVSIQGNLAALAFRYRVGPAAIERALASVRLLHSPGTPLDEGALITGLRHNIAERLGGLAQRVEVTQTWDDLVLADDTRDLIAALVGRIRHAYKVLDQWGYRKKIARGAGVAALFSGPPGTGKTMVAGLIARELDLELYQVDLSKVISKWIGETEKNLARVFDAAEEGHALLLFDEADALFGQRSSDMKSANDRYANLEVNYLLQRVEAFGGITILTTNLETAIDDALKRRLAAHVVFAKPDEDERALLWERQSNTGEAPLGDDIRHEELAAIFPNMTGANIRNAVIAAAFLAAADGSSRISQTHLIRAGRAEYRSMGHVLSESVSSLSAPRRGL